MLPFIFAGLTTGSVFGLAAVGLVLSYKTSGVLNFGHGALASASAFLFYFLHTQHHVAWPLAAGLCIFAFGPLLGLLLERVTRGLAAARATISVLGTVGILLAIQAVLNLLYAPGQESQVQQFLPTTSFSVGGATLAAYQLIIFGVGAVAVGILTIYLRSSRHGVAMRAVVENADLVGLAGTSPQMVRRSAWMVSTSMATASGVILAPLLPLDSTTITFLVVTAFGAAAVGAFTNLPLTYVGGLGIGVGQAVLQKYFVSSTGLTGGLASSLPFLILFALLVAAPRLKRPGAPVLGRTSRIGRASGRLGVRFAELVILAGLLAIVPTFAGIHLLDWTQTVAFVVVFLSLGLLVRLSGQVSLAHVSFMAIGVAVFSQLTVMHHWPWGLALVIAALATALIGAVLAIPAIRFPGVYLALASLGFAILLQQMFYSQSYMFGSVTLGLSVPRPYFSWLTIDTDTGYYYVTLAIACLVALVVIAAEHGRLGRLLAAMSDSSAGLAACGASINISRVLVFMLSAALAAVGGVLAAGAVGIVGADQYQPLMSIQLFAVVLIVLGPTPWYALIAAAGQIIVPSYISASATVQYVFTLIFGLSALFLAMAHESERGLPTWRPSWTSSLQRRPRRSAAGEVVGQISGRPDGLARKSLSIEGITVRFGGLVAADHVHVSAPVGRITGLIGPNGAGKSTIFNACAGAVQPASGAVYLGGRELRHLGPPARARLGLGRTFQQTELFDSLTVRENVALGAEAAYAGWNPLEHIFATRSQQRSITQRRDEALALCGLTDLADTPVGVLSTGHRRLVELARCAAGNYDVLLLDEPSAGLNHVETTQFGSILRDLVTVRGVGLLLIEHDMSLINELCDFVHVVDFGHKIFEGSVSELATSNEVRRAYLGEDVGAASTVDTPER
jgi:ABC-type branched-subunit amino acid transport system ATPase component/branched-subunit amino acid ABC-type transport system permease component